MWAEAYLEQARSDWEAYQLIVGSACVDCHGLHYLQMTAEKLGKAVLLRSGGDLGHVVTTHKAFVRFLQVASRNPGLRRSLEINARQLQEYVKEILPVADQIERLAPALANNGPNAEYPWEMPSRQVVAPAAYIFPVSNELRGSKGRKLLRLIAFMLDQFDVFF